MEKLIILDSNSLINRAYYALPNFSNRKGQYTGAIFGYINMLLKLIDNYKPDYVIATFDRKAPTFRKAIYSEYKGTRKPMPQELFSQMEPLKEIIRAMNIPILEMDGYEADDIIGTIAKKYPIKTYIVTGDKDSLQLVDQSTTVLLTRKGVTEIDEYDIPKLASEGMRPSQIIDLKSLMGDASDNIPGVPGVGEKTARDLLAKYDTLDGVYENIQLITGKLKEKLENNKEMAYMSYKLATINIESPIEIELDTAKLKMPFTVQVRDLLKELELNKIVDRLEFVGESKIIEEPLTTERIVDNTAFEKVVDDIKKNKQFSLIIGQDVEIAVSKNKAYSIEISNNLLEGIFYDDLLHQLKPLLESREIKKVLYDVKTVKHLLGVYDINVNLPYEDVLLKAYLCDANRNYKSLDDLKNAYNINSPSLAASIFILEEEVSKEMQEKKLAKLYNEVEKPLIEVLYDMEIQGFRIDKNKVKELSAKFSEEIDQLTKDIYEFAGEEFNINSPKQLGVILFDKLNLAKGKKTKTGYSTNVEVLQSLINEHPIMPLILRYREIQKLKSTYLDGMLPLVDSEDKIHTIFKQTVTATGRLSSTEPNLQNIPVRKPEGKQIRGMFVASKNKVLVCADYSQIELRLMAEFSGDESMIHAFNNNVDIHATTASKIFGLPLSEVSSDIRRQAKAVNFGIIYGISDYGLSQDLGIPVYKAKDFINNYFATYPKIKNYMENAVKTAEELGYAQTFMGRIRYIPELTSSNYNLREFGKRVAMNMPLQGSASDIIKVAMIRVYDSLKEHNLKSKLIMQVHDELIIDCIPDEVEKVKDILKDSMENVVKFSVKLEAEVGVGENWLEAK